MSFRPFALYSLIIVFVCWFFGFFIFAFYACSLQADSDQNADAVVVLTGGADRLQTGFELLQKKRAPLLFITGVNDDVSPHQLLNQQKDTLKDAIYLDYSADNTYQNALAIKDWTAEQNVQSILLVTSFYHMPRSLFEISKQVPDVKIYPVSVFLKQQEHWIRSRSAWLVFVEYNKFIVRYIQFQIRRVLL